MGAGKSKADWIIAHDGTKGDDAYMLECLRCGEKERVATPISIKAYVAKAKAFRKIHKLCRKPSDTAP
jgi:hypothetical protein